MRSGMLVLNIMLWIAVIVGVHFVGLAKGIPVRSYFAAGAAMVAIGVIALLATAWHLTLITGALCAVTLWISAIALGKGIR